MVNVIFDDRHPDDYQRLLSEFNSQGIIDYLFWDAVVLEKESVVKCISMSHKNIVKWAKEKNLNEVCIMEQDCFFPAKDGWEYFLRNKPTNYDIYSSGTYISDIQNKNILCGFHLIFVNSSYYDTFLSVDEKQHIDTEINSIGGNFVVCRPFAALQRAGFSANNNSIVNYNSILQPEDIYKG